MAQLWSSDHYFITDDRSAIDFAVVHGFLSTCYWSHSIPRDTLRRAIDHSLCFSIFARPAAAPQTLAQVGFARVISDHATFAYLCDVFVLESHRNRGLSKRLMECIIAHPSLQGLRRFCLLTRDAHRLYAQYGFTPMPDPTRYMEIARPDMYRAAASQHECLSS